MQRWNRRRVRAAWPIVLALAVMAGVGPAARADEPAAAKPGGETDWYGWQTLASDGTAIALWTAAAYLNDARSNELSNIAVAAGFAVYLFGAPALHARRGHWDKFGSSLGARLMLPVVGALVGVFAAGAICQPEGDDDVPCPIIGGLYGFAAGGVAAMIVDAAGLARDGGASVTPLITPASGGVSFTLAGRF